MAEAFFNKRAKERNIQAISESAGTIGVGALHPGVIRVMEESGAPLDEQKPKQLTPEMVERATIVISFGGLLGERSAVKFVANDDWPMRDPAGESYGDVRVIRDQISDRVDTLLEQLKA